MQNLLLIIVALFALGYQRGVAYLKNNIRVNSPSLRATFSEGNLLNKSVRFLITIPLVSSLGFSIPLQSFKGNVLFNGLPVVPLAINNAGNINPGVNDIIIEGEAGVFDTVLSGIQAAIAGGSGISIKGHFVYILEGRKVIVPITINQNQLISAAF